MKLQKPTLLLSVVYSDHLHYCCMTTALCCGPQMSTSSCINILMTCSLYYIRNFQLQMTSYFGSRVFEKIYITTQMFHYSSFLNCRLKLMEPIQMEDIVLTWVPTLSDVFVFRNISMPHTVKARIQTAVSNKDIIGTRALILTV